MTTNIWPQATDTCDAAKKQDDHPRPPLHCRSTTLASERQLAIWSPFLVCRCWMVLGSHPGSGHDREPAEVLAQVHRPLGFELYIFSGTQGSEPTLPWEDDREI